MECYNISEFLAAYSLESRESTNLRVAKKSLIVAITMKYWNKLICLNDPIESINLSNFPDR
jgi:hypothetical protein